MDDNKFPWRIVGIIIGIIIVILVLISAIPIALVGAGERGVIFNTFTGVQDRVLGEGVHLRIPFVESVHKMSIKVQKNDIKAGAASSDLQEVNADIVVNWHLEAGKVNKIYQNIGDNQAVIDNILTPAVSEVVKSATAKYKAEDTINKRPLLKQDIDIVLKERLLTYNIIVDDVSIVDINFSDDFNKAIESKNVAVQNAQKAVNDLTRIKTEAEQTVAKATADAQALKIKNDALAQNPALIEYEKAQKWNGVLPQYMLGSVVPFMSIGK